MKKNDSNIVKDGPEMISRAYFDKVDAFYSKIAAHPFIIAFLACVLLTPLCFGAQQNITESAKMIWCLIGFSFPGVLLLLLYRKGKIQKAPAIVCSFVILVCGIFLSYGFTHSSRASLWIFFCIASAAALFRFSVMSDKERSDRHNAFMIMSISFAIKFCYVLYSSCYTRQNDVRTFNSNAGHAGYIEYLIQNKQLPDFDPVTRWQFYHPPFHHTVSAFWIDFCENVLGASRNFARESLQMLMLFYSVAAVIIVYKLLKYFHFKGGALLLPLALFAFHPSFILSSGAINNDQLAALLTIATMLFTFRWFDDPTMQNIIPIAFSIGFGMMTKLNVGTIAAGVGILFVWKFAERIKDAFKMISQFAVFLVICVPLAFWWQIRNLILWKTPITYVPLVGGDQVIDMGIFERLTDFSGKQFSPVFENWIRDGSSFTEYNPNIAIMKNSLFGESINADNFPGKNTVIPTVFFWLALVLALIGVAATFWMLFVKKTKLRPAQKLFFVSYWTFSMLYFYMFCSKYPATCTQNFRYLTPLLVVTAVVYAMLLDTFKSSEKGAAKAAYKVVSGMVAAFCVLSVIVYLLVGYAEVK